MKIAPGEVSFQPGQVLSNDRGLCVSVNGCMSFQFKSYS